MDFQLRRVHELEGDADVVIYGQTGQVGYYTHLAQVIAFGNRGALWLPADPVDSAKTYFLMQQLQQRYVMEKVAAIRYGAAGDKATGPEDLLSSEDAVTSGAYLLSRVYVAYQNGLQLWVNGGPADWTIKAAGLEWTLPSGGWLAQQGDFIEFSARVGGRRLDVVMSPEYIYVDPHERPLEPAEFRSLGLPQGPLVGTDVPVVLQIRDARRQQRADLRRRFVEDGSRTIVRVRTAAVGAGLIVGAPCSKGRQKVGARFA